MNKKLEDISGKLDLIRNFAYFMEEIEQNQNTDENFEINSLVHDFSQLDCEGTMH